MNTHKLKPDRFVWPDPESEARIERARRMVRRDDYAADDCPALDVAMDRLLGELREGGAL